MGVIIFSIHRNVFHEPNISLIKNELSQLGEILDDGSKKKVSFLQEKYLDLPGYWSGPIKIERDLYERHFAGIKSDGVNRWPRREYIVIFKVKSGEIWLPCQ